MQGGDANDLLDSLGHLRTGFLVGANTNHGCGGITSNNAPFK
jgi:hypothetical protein